MKKITKISIYAGAIILSIILGLMICLWVKVATTLTNPTSISMGLFGIINLILASAVFASISDIIYDYGQSSKSMRNIGYIFLFIITFDLTYVCIVLNAPIWALALGTDYGSVAVVLFKLVSRPYVEVKPTNQKQLQPL